jgi:hypothetical protein
VVQRHVHLGVPFIGRVLASPGHAAQAQAAHIQISTSKTAVFHGELLARGPVGTVRMGANLIMLQVAAQWWELTCSQAVNVMTTKAPEPLVFCGGLG